MPDRRYDPRRGGWIRPTVTIYKAADRTTVRLRLNRYPEQIIGAAIHIHRTVIGIQWKRPGSITPTENARRAVEDAAREVRRG